MIEHSFDLNTERGMVDYTRHVYEICSKRFPLRNDYRIHVRIGFYRSDYQKEKDGTMIQFEDGMTFPVPRLLERDPTLYIINQEVAAPPMIVPLRIIPEATVEEETLSFGAFIRHRKTKERSLVERRGREIRERVFYNCLNRYLLEQGIDEDVKVGPDIVEAFTLEDNRSFLRSYMLSKTALPGLYLVVGIAMSFLIPLFVILAIPGAFFTQRILVKVRRLERHLRSGRGGGYLLKRIRE